MIRVFALMFSPFNTWMRIEQRQQGVMFILFVSLLPMAVICAGLESLALVRWGEQRIEFGSLAPVSEAVAFRYAATHVILFLACAIVGAFSLQAMAQSFHLSTTFQQAFRAFAYGISPVMLARLLDAIPAMNTWVCWAIGGVLAISALYHGVALVLRPEQTKGFGLYLLSVVIAILCTGVAHLLALAVLREKILG